MSRQWHVSGTSNVTLMARQTRKLFPNAMTLIWKKLKGTLKKKVTIKERGGYKPFKAKHFGGFKGTVPTQYHIPSCIQRNEFVKRSHKKSRK